MIRTSEEHLSEGLDWASLASHIQEYVEYYWTEHYYFREDGSFGIMEGSIYEEVDGLINKLTDAARLLAGTKLSYVSASIESGDADVFITEATNGV